LKRESLRHRSDRHRLAIIGLVASLDLVELITRIVTRALWKVAQALSAFDNLIWPTLII
jgi:hypothetical protein